MCNNNVLKNIERVFRISLLSFLSSGIEQMQHSNKKRWRKRIVNENYRVNATLTALNRESCVQDSPSDSPHCHISEEAEFTASNTQGKK